MDKQIIDKIVHLLKKFGYVSFEYPDGRGKKAIDQAVIYYHMDRFPFNSTSFKKDSNIRVALEEIEKDIQSLDIDDDFSIQISVG